MASIGPVIVVSVWYSDHYSLCTDAKAPGASLCASLAETAGETARETLCHMQTFSAQFFVV